MKKQKEEEDNKPAEEEKKKKQEDEDNSEDEEETMKSLIKKVDALTDAISDLRKTKQEEDEEEKKKQDDEEDEDKKKKQEDDEDEEKKKQEEDDDDEDKKKEIEPTKPKSPGPSPDGEPEVGQGETKLPQAPAGETNEDAKEENDEVQILEKAKAEISKGFKGIKKEIEDVFKAHGITRTLSQRPVTQDIAKKGDIKANPDGMDMLNAVRKDGKSLTEIKKQARETMVENREIGLKNLLANRGVA